MPSIHESPFLCKTFISSSPLDLHPGFSIDSLSPKLEHAVYVSPETTILNVLQLVWTTLPPTLKSHRARYNIKSLFSLDDRDRPGYLVWKTRHLADVSQQDVLRDNKSEDEHGSRSKTLGDCKFRSNDSLYITVHLPPSVSGPGPSAPGALFSIRGAAGRPDNKNSNGFTPSDAAGGGGGAPRGEGSWIDARKEHPPVPPGANYHGRDRGDRRNGGGGGGGRGRPAPGGNDRYFDSRDRSRSPPPRRGGNGARRPSPSY